MSSRDANARSARVAPIWRQLALARWTMPRFAVALLLAACGPGAEGAPPHRSTLASAPQTQATREGAEEPVVEAPQEGAEPARARPVFEPAVVHVRIAGSERPLRAVPAEGGWLLATYDPTAAPLRIALQRFPGAVPLGTVELDPRAHPNALVASGPAVVFNDLQASESFDVARFDGAASAAPLAVGGAALSSEWRAPGDGCAMVRRDDGQVVTQLYRAGVLRASLPFRVPSRGQMFGMTSEAVVMVAHSGDGGFSTRGPGRIYVDVVGAERGEARWSRELPTPAGSGGSGRVALAVDGSVHLLLNPDRWDEAGAPTWLRVPSRGRTTTQALPRDGTHEHNGYAIAACEGAASVLASTRRVGDEYVLRVAVARGETLSQPHEVWRGGLEGGRPSVLLACEAGEAFVTLHGVSETHVFMFDVR